MSELSGSRHARERLERWETEQEELRATIRQELAPHVGTLATVRAGMSELALDVTATREELAEMRKTIEMLNAVVGRLLPS
jgi:chromosome segregation ATPase